MNRQILIIIICLALAVILGVLLIWPKYQDFATLQLRLKEANNLLQEKKVYYENLAKLSEELKQYPQELAKIDSVFSQDFSAPSAFDFLQKKASESGLILKQVGDVSVSISKEKTGVQEYRFPIALSGSYSAFKNFLLTIEKSAKIIEVEDVNFSTPTEKEGPFSIYILTMKFYSY